MPQGVTYDGNAECTDGCSYSQQATYKNDYLTTFSGFPGWGQWLNGDYLKNDATTVDIHFYEQPFMVVNDVIDGTNYPQDQNSNYSDALTAYHQLGYDQYGEGTMVPPFPMYVSQNNGIATSGLSPNDKGTNLYRSCSNANIKDSDSGSLFANSFCLYLGSSDHNDDSHTSLSLPAQSSAKYLNEHFAIGGVRDIFGNVYPIIMCDKSSCDGNGECACVLGD